MLKFIIPLALIAASPASAQTRPHLCTPAEEAVFACSTGAKIISLCASKETGESAGYLQYRFGTKKQIELAYPASTSVRPQGVFTGGVTGTSGGGTDYLRFTRESIVYTLFADYYRGRERDGVVIERAGKRIGVLICRGGAMEPGKGWGTVYKAKLPRDDAGFETP